MRRAVICRLLGVAVLSATLEAQSFPELAHACVPAADLGTIQAIVRTESAFRPYVLSLNRPASLAAQLGLPPGRLYLKTQPKERKEAIAWANQLLSSGYTLSVGLMQISTETGKPLNNLLDPCQNLKLGWEIFSGKYAQAAQSFGPGQRALQAALSLYNCGSFTTGYQNGYVSQVIRNAK